MMQENVKNFTYTFSPSNLPGQEGLEAISYGSKLIKNFARLSAMNVEENLKNGMYASTLFTHDIFNKNIQKFEFNYENDYDRRNSVNMNKKSHGPLVSLL